MSKNYTINYSIAFLLLILLLASCSARKDYSLFNAPTDIVTDTIKQVYVVNDQGIESAYRIKTNDLLAVRNLQNKYFGGTGTGGVATGITVDAKTITSYEVEPDGNVNLPAIGKVAVIGLTRREAASKIQDLYKDSVLNQPIIELSIVNLKVTVLGEFSKQGNFLLEGDNTTLIDIIGEAGGITKNADPKTLKIIRGNRSNPEIIYVNLNDINSLAASKKLVLQNNDIIYLQQTKSGALAGKLQGINNVLQPFLVIVNLGVLIFTLTR
jgi:polysaccharide export outer membrane protein